jgi:dTDP-4-dehydrorhamnose reductase
MKLLVLGCNGQLGWEICRQGEDRGFDIIPLDFPEIDITNRDNINEKIVPYDFNILINCAAYTAVDRAETEHELAYAVNRDGPAFLAEICAERNIPLIHVSTDYVFSGNKDGCNMETDLVEPLGVYGGSKAEGEDRVRSILDKHLILRTSWLYGVHGTNFVKTMINLGKEREEIRVVADQYGCPTFAADLAEAILDITDQYNEDKNINWGTYHFCGRGSTTWHGFASKIFEIAKLYDQFKVKKVTPIKTTEYLTPAERPKNSVMDCSLLKGCFNINPPLWEDSLGVMLRRYYQ